MAATVKAARVYQLPDGTWSWAVEWAEGGSYIDTGYGHILVCATALVAFLARQ